MLSQLRREAKRLAHVASDMFPSLKKQTRTEAIQDAILKKIMDGNKLASLSGVSQERIKTCCKSVNGLCYMMALDAGSLKNLINVRSLQFTEYMDEELQSVGFPEQTIEQKKEIMEAMELGPAFKRYLELKNESSK